MTLAISFLGTGLYEPTTYVWEDHCCKTRLFPEAVESFFDLDRHLVLSTEGAEQKWGAELREHISYTRLPIPLGETEEELWSVFEAVVEAVPEDADLTIDVTHGFRSQPLLALAVGLYLQAAKGATIERVVYGAYEARSGDAPDDTSPVFDLTAFVDLATWATAVRLSQQHGNATPLKRMLSDVHGESHKRGGEYQSQALYDVGTSLDRLLQALATVRPSHAVEEAQKVPKHLDQVESDIQNLPQSRPLQALIGPFRERFAPMGSDALFSASGFEAQAKMLTFYLETDQYQQAITLAREAIISKRCVEMGRDPSSKEGRLESAEELNDLADRIQEETIKEDGRAALATLWGNIRRVRNDVNHAGMNDDPLPPEAMREQIDEYSSEAAARITTSFS